MPVAQQTGRAQPAKSKDAFRTISEVAEQLDLPQHVLRFWETRFSQIKPLKRGGGRRLYRPDHVALLRGIRALLYDDGMTIKGVQKVLREKGVRAVIARGESNGALVIEAPDVPADASERLGRIAERRRVSRPGAEGEQPGLPFGEVRAGGGGGGDGARIEASIRRLEDILARLEAKL